MEFHNGTQWEGIDAGFVTFANLLANGGVGTGPNMAARGQHRHELDTAPERYQFVDSIAPGDISANDTWEDIRTLPIPNGTRKVAAVGAGESGTFVGLRWRIVRGSTVLLEIKDAVNQGAFPSGLQSPLGMTWDGSRYLVLDITGGELWTFADHLRPQDAVNRGAFPSGLQSPQGMTWDGSRYLVLDITGMGAVDVRGPPATAGRGEPWGLPPRAGQSHTG